MWDIFRAEDADKIRAYLSRKFGSKHIFVDPIHAQVFFLDASMRRELWEKHGVVSHRIYQYPVSRYSHSASTVWQKDRTSLRADDFVGPGADTDRARQCSFRQVAHIRCAISQTASRSHWTLCLPVRCVAWFSP